MAKISRRRLIKGAAAGLGAALATSMLGCRAKSSRAAEGDVVLLVMDTFRADSLGLRMNGQEVTPNINRFGKECLTFTHAYSAAPSTKYSMSSIFSGMYPPGHGVEYARFTLPDCLTLARYLSQRGYFTGGVISNPWLAPEIGPESSLRSMGFGFNNGFYYYRNAREKREVEDSMKMFAPFPSGEEVNESFFTMIDRQIPEGYKGKPRFLYAHYMDSHQPWLGPTVRKGITGKFHEHATGEESFGEDVKLVRKIIPEETGRITTTELSPDEAARLRSIYREAACYADSCIGQALEGLKQRGIYEDATIILTSDHGEELLEHGKIGHGQQVYDESLRVPLFIRRKGLAPRTIGSRVTNAAILPTLMEWFGDELKGTNVPSLLPVINDGAGDLEIFASLFKRDKFIGADGIEVLKDAEAYKSFDIGSDPEELVALPPDAKALSGLEKTRFWAEKLAKEAGVTRCYSTYAWQNPDVDAQNRLAQVEIDNKRLTPEEAAYLKSKGQFIPRESTDSAERTEIDPSKLAPELRDKLKALGYLN